MALLDVAELRRENFPPYSSRLSQNCFIIWYLSSTSAISSQTSTYCITCVHTQLLKPTQHTKQYPLPSDLETSKLHFPGQVLAKKCACTIPDGENVHEDSMYSCGSFQLSSVPQRQLSASADILGLEVDGMDQAAAYCSCTGRSTPSCANETANACVREHSTLPRRVSLSGLIVMAFQRLSSRRIQSSRPSETFACPAWGEYLPGFANSKSSSKPTVTVTLFHKPRFTLTIFTEREWISADI